ncbi:predicted protein [Naegleria gruberi]|uniref:Predicted protein n=1 Tax=Naegleria gruberi TaxID=5762 RepID=D2VK64_NAEGR|nr:uncharacterized protein NAEGRDRAFT_50221 [Naegleria gruberi]EFC42808.1 predicted protein [Naegleria gruberi]|eukprot:XP_002675552.1 predicted protein [Naegleria gruberi strain NEG-M]
MFMLRKTKPTHNDRGERIDGGSDDNRFGSNRGGGISSWKSSNGDDSYDRNNRNNNNRGGGRRSYNNNDRYDNNRQSSYNNDRYDNNRQSYDKNNRYNNKQDDRYNNDKNQEDETNNEDDLVTFGTELSQLNIAEVFDSEGKNQIRTARSILSYFRRIESLMNKDDFPTNEDRIQFITSVFNYTIEMKNLFEGTGDEQEQKKKGNYALIVSLNNPVIAKCLQTMVPLSSSEDLRGFLNACSNHLHIISNGRFSSFLIQEALKYVPEVVKEESHVENLMQDDELDSKPTMTDIIIEAYNSSIEPNLFDMIFHKNASFVVRQLPLCLGYIKSKKELGKTLLDLMVDKVISSCPIGDILNDSIALGFLTSLMENVSTFMQMIGKTDAKLLSKIIKYAIEQTSDEELTISSETITKLLSSTQHSRIVELIISIGDEGIFSNIVEKILAPNAESFATDKNKCYTIVNAIERANREQFILLFNALRDSIKKCFSEGILNVITCLAKGCLKFNTKEQELIQQLLKGLTKDGEKTNEQAIEELLYLEDKTTCNRHGCNLLSTLFTFQSKKMLNPLLNIFKEMDEEKLFTLCTTKETSMVIDSLVQMSDEFIQKIKPKLVDLSVNVYGAFVVEKAMLECKDSKLHMEIATILKDAETKIRSSKPGSVLWNKTNLSQFKSNPNDWLQRKEEQRSKKKKNAKMIQEMANVNIANSSSKKKKPKKERPQKKEQAPSTTENIEKTEAVSTIETAEPVKKEKKQKEKPTEEKTEKKESKKKSNEDLSLDFLEVIDEPKKDKKRKKESVDMLDFVDNILESSLKKKKK